MDLTIDLNIFLTAIGVGANIGLISWLRADMKSFETEMRGWRQDFEAEMRGWREDFRKDMSIYRDEVKNEMKDFHGRLCMIEERNKK